MILNLSRHFCLVKFNKFTQNITTLVKSRTQLPCFSYPYIIIINDCLVLEKCSQRTTGDIELGRQVLPQLHIHHH